MAPGNPRSDFAVGEMLGGHKKKSIWHIPAQTGAGVCLPKTDAVFYRSGFASLLYLAEETTQKHEKNCGRHG
jgi:hypothetical protein